VRCLGHGSVNELADLLISIIKAEARVVDEANRMACQHLARIWVAPLGALAGDAHSGDPVCIFHGLHKRESLYHVVD